MTMIKPRLPDEGDQRFNSWPQFNLASFQDYCSMIWYWERLALKGFKCEVWESTISSSISLHNTMQAEKQNDASVRFPGQLARQPRQSLVCTGAERWTLSLTMTKNSGTFRFTQTVLRECRYWENVCFESMCVLREHMYWENVCIVRMYVFRECMYSENVLSECLTFWELLGELVIGRCTEN